LHLVEVARKGEAASYDDVYSFLGIGAKGRSLSHMRRLSHDLTALMEYDIGKGRPPVAALVIQRRKRYPARGYFAAAEKLGLYKGQMIFSRRTRREVQQLHRHIRLWMQTLVEVHAYWRGR